eukprot:CAMPEP_0198256244 /NCGR_PEP_ID=MMETSP1447-20131203/6193_1 /TAXON_ID=420782 /ORGANISM="Chaetoceros dichaeta, Strain CCMP1751" /LENGTH=174 /DNA_ID=CAMNT_0043942835 /DNA_START=114 /DNA_END=638 /DNA_ORIENTATION=-
MPFKQLFCALVALLMVGSSSAQKGITIKEFKTGVDNRSYDMILDVRTQEEWDTGHIPGSILVPIDTFSEDNFWLQMNNSGYSCNKSCATIVVIGFEGGRGQIAIDKLREMGFEGTLYNSMGIKFWVAAGYDLTLKDDSPKPVCKSTDICPNSSSTNTIVGLGAGLVILSLLFML